MSQIREAVYTVIRKRGPIFQSEIPQFLDRSLMGNAQKDSIRQRISKVCIQLEEERKIKRYEFNYDRQKNEYGGHIAEMNDQDILDKERGPLPTYICEART